MPTNLLEIENIPSSSSKSINSGEIGIENFNSRYRYNSNHKL